MARLNRKTAILAKIETTYGVDPVPTGAANAVLISNPSFTFSAANIDRAIVREYLGGSEQLIGSRYVEASFDVELQGAGAAGTAAPFGPLLRACGFAEAIIAGNRVEYTPISASFESVTIYYHKDGVLRKLLGCRGSFKLGMGLGNRPAISFHFLGIDGGVTATADPTQTLTLWKTPAVITDVNTADLLLGCTYSAGALSGGTAYPSKGIEIDAGISVNHVPLLGGESIDLTDRSITAKIELDLTAAQEVAVMNSVKDNTTQAIGLQHGNVAGSIVVVYAPACQLTNPADAEYNGRLMQSYDVRCVPSAGNDELRLVVR